MAFDPWELLIIAGSLGFILCLMPQLVKTVKTKRADDLSLGFLVLVLVSSALTLPYQIHIGQRVFAVAQTVNLIVWGTVCYYKLRPGTPAAQG
ncbi:MAG: PQ-loop domain-containing transporter [Candidatus Thermoplasmatota archaeon]